jgi:hypothetical protein
MIGKIKLIFIPGQENNYRPKFLDSRILFYYAILIIILRLSLLPFFLYFPKTAFFAAITKSVLIELTNQTRKSFGLSALKENPKLTQSAYLKAEDMLGKDYFSHQSPEGIWPWDWLKRVSYNYSLAGENLAIGFLDSEEVHQAWLNSSSHKANILNPNYQEIGIAVSKGEFEGNEVAVVVQLFGSPEVLAKEEEKPKTEISEKPLEKSAETIGETEVLPAEISFPPPEPPLPPEPFQTETLPRVSIEKPEEKLTFHFLEFMAFNYNNFVQKFIYGSLIFVILALLINIFVRIDIQHKDLIFKALGFIGLLILFLWLDKSEIIQLIPHQFQIYPALFEYPAACGWVAEGKI